MTTRKPPNLARAAIALAVTALGLAACGDPTAKTLSRADTLIADDAVPQAAALLRTLLQRLDARAGRGQKVDAVDADAAAAAIAVQTRLAALAQGPLHDPVQAIADYSQVVRRDPQGPAALHAQQQLADLYAHHVGEPQLAVAALRAAANTLGARLPGAQVREQLWRVLLAMGNYDGAFAEAQGILERWPNTPYATRARLTMGQADYLAGRIKRATATLEALVDATAEPQMRARAQVELGNCYQEQGETARALTSYHAALGAHPNPALVQGQIARVRERLHQMAPQDGILNASRPSRHIASWLPRPTPQELGIGGP